MVEFPPGVAIHVDVDEELFAPLTGHMSDVVDGRAELWISGANLEDTRAPRTFAPEQARLDFAVMLLRAKDRLSDEFASAPPDRELVLQWSSLRQQVAQVLTLEVLEHHERPAILE